MTIKKLFGISSPTIGKIPQELPNHTGHEISSQQVVGIEVEVENAAPGRVRDFWIPKGDGSLRNNGMEFVTLPIRACDAPKALYSLMSETLNQDSCFSPRTSVHVHVDYTDNTPDDVVNTLLLYCVYERVLFNFVGKQRIKNIYCVPITETELLGNIAREGLRPARWQKYSGLNVRPLTEIGTIEYRHMHGTFDMKKLCVWIDLITSLKEYVLKTGTKDIRKTITEMTDDFDFTHMGKEIFGTAASFLSFAEGDYGFTYKQAKLAMSRPTHAIAGLNDTFSRDSFYYKLGV